MASTNPPSSPKPADDLKAAATAKPVKKAAAEPAAPPPAEPVKVEAKPAAPKRAAKKAAAEPPVAPPAAEVAVPAPVEDDSPKPAAKSKSAAPAKSVKKAAAEPLATGVQPEVGEAKAEGAVEAAPAEQPGPDQAEIHRMIAEAAYYLAEKRNFQPGFEQEDWAAATADVMARLRGGEPS